MPETTNVFPGTNVPMTPQTAAANTPKEEQTVQTTVLETVEGVDYCLGEFEEGDAKGLKFAYPRFSSVESIVKLYTAEKVLEMVNQAVKAKIATKIKGSKIPKNVTPEIKASQLKALIDGDPSGRGLVFTVEEAKQFKPGEREPGMKDLLAEAMEKVRKGDIDGDSLKALLVKMSMKARK